MNDGEVPTKCSTCGGSLPPDGGYGNPKLLDLRCGSKACVAVEVSRGRRASDASPSAMIEVILFGEVVPVRVSRTGAEVRAAALIAGTRTGRPAEDWELRTEMGAPVSPDQNLGGLADGTRLFLTLVVGAGGNAQRPNDATPAHTCTGAGSATCPACEANFAATGHRFVPRGWQDRVGEDKAEDRVGLLDDVCRWLAWEGQNKAAESLHENRNRFICAVPVARPNEAAMSELADATVLAIAEGRWGDNGDNVQRLAREVIRRRAGDLDNASSDRANHGCACTWIEKPARISVVETLEPCGLHAEWARAEARADEKLALVLAQRDKFRRLLGSVLGVLDGDRSLVAELRAAFDERPLGSDACVVLPGADSCGACHRGTAGCAIFHYALDVVPTQGQSLDTAKGGEGR